MRKIVLRDNPCLCIKLRRAAHTLTKLYDEAFSPLNLTTSQFSLLNDIQQLRSCNKTELARYAGLDRTTIIRNLSVLREKGFIEDGPEDDRKNGLVRLTDAGDSVLKEGLACWKKAQAEVRSAIGPAKLQILKEIFSDIESLNAEATERL